MSIFRFSKISTFLHDYIRKLPKKGRGELSRIAVHLRVSTTLVSQIAAGDKHFTTEQASSVCSFLGLSGLEADYFNFLVQTERAGSPAAYKFWSAKLDEIRERSLKLANRVFTDRVLTEEERATFYSTPLYSAIRLFTSTGKGEVSLEELCERFEVPRARAGEIMNFLLRCGLCTEKNGRYGMGAQKTHLEQGSPHLLKHYSNWRIRAIQRSERLSAQELMYTAPVSLSRKDFESLREEMVQFIKRFLDRVHDSPAEELACFNLDFFWIEK